MSKHLFEHILFRNILYIKYFYQRWEFIDVKGKSKKTRFRPRKKQDSRKKRKETSFRPRKKKENTLTTKKKRSKTHNRPRKQASFTCSNLCGVRHGNYRWWIQRFVSFYVYCFSAPLSLLQLAGFCLYCLYGTKGYFEPYDKGSGPP